jgi:hypothetical protein
MSSKTNLSRSIRGRGNENFAYFWGLTKHYENKTIWPDELASE